MVRTLLLGLVLAAGAAPQEGPPAFSVKGQPTQEMSPLVPPSTKAPFRVTFQNPTPQAQDALLRLKALVATDTKVSCGLTMVQVDPKVDPKIRRELPTPAGQKPNLLRQPDFKVRRITPTVCRE
jgi:hypothetical protein